MRKLSTRCNRDTLWVKLFNSGLSYKIIEMLKSVYENVKACVKLSPNMNYSEFFDVTLGLKQGNHSPRCFLYFLSTM